MNTIFFIFEIIKKFSENVVETFCKKRKISLHFYAKKIFFPKLRVYIKRLPILFLLLGVSTQKNIEKVVIKIIFFKLKFGNIFLSRIFNGPS